MSNAQRPNNAIVPIEQKQRQLKDMLQRTLPSMAGIASGFIKPDRLIRIALVAASRRPELLECTPNSLLLALMQAAQVGLEPETPLAHAYLVPFKNTMTGNKEATFMPSARGLATIAKRQGGLKTCRARMVFEGDEFDYEEGLEPRLHHKPLLAEIDDNEANNRAIVFGYAVAIMADGEKEFVVMTRAQIERVRRSSKSPDKGPWVDWFDRMAEKTVMKRLLRQLPLDNEQLATALATDDANMSGNAPQLAKGDDGILHLVAEDTAAAASRADAAAAEIENKRKSKAAAKDAQGQSTPATVPPANQGQQQVPLDEQKQIEKEERESAEREGGQQ